MNRGKAQSFKHTGKGKKWKHDLRLLQQNMIELNCFEKKFLDVLDYYLFKVTSIFIVFSNW